MLRDGTSTSFIAETLGLEPAGSASTPGPRGPASYPRHFPAPPGTPSERHVATSQARGGREGEGVDWPLGVRLGDSGWRQHSNQSPEGQGTQSKTARSVRDAGWVTSTRRAPEAGWWPGPRVPAPRPEPGVSRAPPEAGRFQSGRWHGPVPAAAPPPAGAASGGHALSSLRPRRSVRGSDSRENLHAPELWAHQGWARGRVRCKGTCRPPAGSPRLPLGQGHVAVS